MQHDRGEDHFNKVTSPCAACTLTPQTAYLIDGLSPYFAGMLSRRSDLYYNYVFHRVNMVFIPERLWMIMMIMMTINKSLVNLGISIIPGIIRRVLPRDWPSLLLLP